MWLVLVIYHCEGLHSGLVGAVPYTPMTPYLSIAVALNTCNLVFTNDSQELHYSPLGGHNIDLYLLLSIAIRS